VEGLASDNPWNPASRDFWGSEPVKRANLLFIVAILGLVFSFGGQFMTYYIFYWYGEYSLSGVPFLHGLILLLAVKMKSKPSDMFSLLLGLLVIWSFAKIFFSLINLVEFGGLDVTPILVHILLSFWIAGITVLLWKRTRDKEHYGPNPNTLLIIISVILIMATYHDASMIYDYTTDSVDFVLLYLFSGSLGTPLFWGVFILLYIYRTEIEPWEDASTSYESQQTRSGISAYNASKLKEAKELLDNGVISEKEFQEIKDEYLN
jgi:hypothetical protein